VKEGIAAHFAELKGHANLGPKPKSVQHVSGEVYRAGGQTGEHPVSNHVNDLKWQATLKGEPAPLQPVPEERKAAERLGTPPPDGENPFRIRQSEEDPNQWVLEYPADEKAPFRIKATLTPKDPGKPPIGEEELVEFGREELPQVMRELYSFLAIARKRANPDADQ
jgi:hypothetical protein